MKKRVLIYAYLEENLGDDLMVWLLCKRYPHIRFEVLTHGVYKEIFKDFIERTKAKMKKPIILYVVITIICIIALISSL